MNWHILNKMIETKSDFKPYIPGCGNFKAGCMIIGGMPTQDELVTGIPFSGRIGRMLKVIIEENNLPLDNIYLTHAIKTFYSGKIGIKEVDIWLEILKYEVSLVMPYQIIALDKISKLAVSEGNLINFINVPEVKKDSIFEVFTRKIRKFCNGCKEQIWEKNVKL